MPADEPRTHDLKVETLYFPHVASGAKTFEVRKDDRGFRVGDVLHLREWSHVAGYSGRSVMRRVTYLTHFAQKDGYVVLALRALQS